MRKILFIFALLFAGQFLHAQSTNGSVNGAPVVMVLPAPSASSLGGIESITLSSHEWVSYIDTSGVPHKSQPACGDLSNSATSCSTDATNSANVNYNQGSTNAVTRTLQSKLGDVISVKDFGAKGDGSTDDTTDIQNALTYAGSNGLTAYFPAGTYEVSSALTSQGSILMDTNATVQATASMAAVFEIGTTGYVRNGFFQGGTIDANGHATDGLWVQQYAQYRMDHITVQNFSGNGFHVGDSSDSPSTSYQAIAHDLFTTRSSGSVGSSVGFFIDTNATDNNISQSIFTDCYYGMEIGTGGNFFTDIHVWSDNSTVGAMEIGFLDEGYGNFWNHVEADTVAEYGMEITDGNPIIQASRFYNNSLYGSDNVVIGIYFTQSTPSATLIGNFFQGEDSSHRLAQDVYSASFGSIAMISNLHTNVVSTQTSGVLVGYNVSTGDQNILGSAGLFGWSSESYVVDAAYDTALSRCSAALVCVGNYTSGSGDFSGGLKLTSLTLADSTTNTKLATFSMSSISPSTEVTMTIPNASGTLVLGGNNLTTTGAVPFVTSSGILTDNSALLWSGSSFEIPGSVTGYSGANEVYKLAGTQAFLLNSGVFGWSSSASTLSASWDTGLSRCSAGVICVGDATQGDYSATLKAANGNFTTAVQTPTVNVLGSSTGYTTVTSANASSTNYSIQIPVPGGANDNVCLQTLLNCSTAYNVTNGSTNNTAMSTGNQSLNYPSGSPCSFLTEFQTGQSNVNYGTNGAFGCTIVLSGSTQYQASGMFGATVNASPNTNAVAGYFSARATANGSGSSEADMVRNWGVNPLLMDGGYTNVLLQNEFDFNVSGSNTFVQGLVFTGASTHNANSNSAYIVMLPLGGVGSSYNVPVGLNCALGATSSSCINIGPSSSSSNSASQYIIFNSTNGGSATNVTLQASSTGVLTETGSAFGGFNFSTVSYSVLGTQNNGTMVYCSNCTENTSIGACSSGGSGAIAFKVNGTWYCT